MHKKAEDQNKFVTTDSISNEKNNKKLGNNCTGTCIDDAHKILNMTAEGNNVDKGKIKEGVFDKSSLENVTIKITNMFSVVDTPNRNL